MSVYKPAKSRYWQYDFRIAGRRYHGSTGQTGRRAAEKAEERLRREAGEGKLGEASQLTLDAAGDKWWAEVGRRRADWKDVERRLDRVTQLIGPNLKLAEITTRVVSDAIQKRLGQGYTKSPKKDAKVYLPSNATVNRDVIETLRPILNRAREHWEAKGLPEIPWDKLRLSEPAETVRIYSAEERAAWRDQCGPTAGLALDLLLTYGLRFGELFFGLDAFLPDGPSLQVKKRKRDVPHLVPLRPDHAAEIAARLGRARAAQLDVIWFVEEVDPKTKAVELKPLTYYGLQARLNTAAKRAKVPPGRLIHGARHHAGTTLMRKTGGNQKMAQRLLGHASIHSTMRYLHAMEDELRTLLDGDEDAGPAQASNNDHPDTVGKGRQS